MVDIYDARRGLVKIGPCKWSPNMDVAFWLSQNDDTILKVLLKIGDIYILKPLLSCVKSHLSSKSLEYAAAAVIREFGL